MRKRKLFKFRSLFDCDSMKWVREIIETGEFWCAKLWEMNDPMEGVYSHVVDELGERGVTDLFSEKNKHVICSFSGEDAFSKASMWGYYANGFKGVAIELEVEADDSSIHEVTYDKNIADWTMRLQGTQGRDEWLQSVMTRKLKDWKGENEFRFLKKGEPGLNAVGNIVRVHFGCPFFNVRNQLSVLSDSSSLQAYYRRAYRLATLATTKGIECCAVRIDGGKVTSGSLDLGRFERIVTEFGYE